MGSKCVYDYYEIAVPGDAFDGDDAIQQLGSLAIDEARERAKLYCVPAEWTSKLISGEAGDFECVFQVVRKRNRRLSNAK